jgi:hypothetical protein
MLQTNVRPHNLLLGFEGIVSRETFKAKTPLRGECLVRIPADAIP